MQGFGMRSRNWKAMEKDEEEYVMRRSGFNIMKRLMGLVKPLTGYMILAVAMGVIGHLCASFITISGGYAVLSVLYQKGALDLRTLFISEIGRAHV